MKTAIEILDNVKKILEERERNYDNPKPNFERIANYFNAYLGERLTTPITPTDVAMLMIGMKLAREQFKHNDDNLLDVIGYAVCALRMVEDEKEITVTYPDFLTVDPKMEWWPDGAQKTNTGIKISDIRIVK